jgi:uncharacterized coiled-coil DUF342 family protein
MNFPDPISESLETITKYFIFLSRERHIRPPNRRRHEEQLDELQNLIAQKDDRRRGLLEEARSAREQLADAKHERDRLNAQKTTVYEELDAVNKEVQKQDENVRRLRGSIVYRSEPEVDAQIRKLEYQMERNNFKLPDERRIVAEIDRLRRSKKILREHSALKQELDRLRERQRECRDARENLFRLGKEVKRHEDGLRQRNAEASAAAEQLRTEIEELKEERRSQVASFRAQEQDFRRSQNAKREELRRRAAEEKEQEAAAREQELRQMRETAEPYLEELSLCTLLIQHCQKMQGMAICIIGLLHKVLTNIEYRGVSGVFRTIDPPPPVHPASVSSPRTKGGRVYTLAGR